ncbi:MAG: helix-turn-helix domain-containing protein [Proteobacteria bacterium]|nr:helix-turn-helix domain-containing protein [Pseudomonadota bacterium]
MNLQTYCEQNGGTSLRGCPVLAQVAIKAECSPDTLYMIAKGHKQCGPILAGKIERATGAAVNRADLRPDIFSMPAKSKPSKREAA